MKDYYDIPTQVVFSDSINEDGTRPLFGGIAFGNIIICGECGGVLELDEFEDGDVRELEWVNIDENIREDETL